MPTARPSSTAFGPTPCVSFRAANHHEPSSPAPSARKYTDTIQLAGRAVVEIDEHVRQLPLAHEFAALSALVQVVLGDSAAGLAGSPRPLHTRTFYENRRELSPGQGGRKAGSRRSCCSDENVLVTTALHIDIILSVTDT